MEGSYSIKKIRHTLKSAHLQRNVIIDIYESSQFEEGNTSLLLINDGQDMEELQLELQLNALFSEQKIHPLLAVGIHCGKDRRNEYGTAGIKDYLGRGAKAALYTRFVMEELLPFVRQTTGLHSFKDKSFAGFSLGGLSAIDIVWNNAKEFYKIGVFSGSLWWRSRDLDAQYDDDKHRIIHQIIRNGDYHNWLKFFFQTGAMDEAADRNNNGIIDSIDDTLDLIKELVNKGYKEGKDVKYLELADGKHDVASWAKAMPVFLKWGWGKD